MKKKFSLILWMASLLLVLLLVTGCSQKEEPISYDAERQLFNFVTANQIESFCKEQDLVCITEEQYQVVYDVSCFGNTSQFLYSFDSDARVDSVAVYMLLHGHSHDNETSINPCSAEELQKKCVDALEHLCQMHGVELQNNFFILDYEQYSQLDITRLESFQKILDGEAYLEFTMMDKGECYWQVYSERMPNGAFFLRIDKYSDSSDYSDLVPNVTVQ